jgi:hypothetical protein
MKDAICIVLILVLLYLVLRKESFLGNQPGDVARVVSAAPNAAHLDYANFNRSIYPTTIHEWTYQEIRNLAQHGGINVTSIRFLLDLDKKYATHPSFDKPLLTYPNVNAPPKTSNFVLQVGTPTKPVWIV